MIGPQSGNTTNKMNMSFVNQQSSSDARIMPPVLTCDSCGKTFNYESRLMRHIETSHDCYNFYMDNVTEVLTSRKIMRKDNDSVNIAVSQRFDDRFLH